MSGSTTPSSDVSAAASKRNVLDRVERPSDPGDDAVAATLRQPAREQLEDRPPVGRAGLPRGLDHGQLVVVGQERR